MTRKVHEYFVYILRCSDGSYYTGVTNSVERRLGEHARGDAPGSYVFRRRPFTLVYSSSFQYVLDAIGWEKQIKRWSRRKKEALIREEYEKLICLSKRKNVQRTMGL